MEGMKRDVRQDLVLHVDSVNSGAILPKAVLNKIWDAITETIAEITAMRNTAVSSYTYNIFIQKHRSNEKRKNGIWETYSVEIYVKKKFPLRIHSIYVLNEFLSLIIEAQICRLNFTVSKFLTFKMADQM